MTSNWVRLKRMLPASIKHIHKEMGLPMPELVDLAKRMGVFEHYRGKTIWWKLTPRTQKWVFGKFSKNKRAIPIETLMELATKSRISWDEVEHVIDYYKLTVEDGHLRID